jgi:type IV pilus assembly protein PilY1
MTHRTNLRFLPAALCAAAMLAPAPQATALNLGSQPLYLGGSLPPIVMLLTPKDHQLFKKAYDDFSDLDGSLPGGDSALEITYKHSIDYYGYFDPFKCYTYSNANGRFEPSAGTSTKYCAAGTAWSGNFLNWVTMSRLDVMRKLLFGGSRSTDIDGTTVLERALIPTEAHAWAKHYRGADLPQLTPFTSTQVPSAPRTYSSTSSVAFPTTFAVPAAAGNLRTFNLNNPSADTHPLLNGDQVTICRAAPDQNQCMFGIVGNVSSLAPYTITSGQNFGSGVNITVTIFGTSGNTGTFASWTITNNSSAGISICNVTQATSGTSHASAAAPLMRVAAGDYSLWGVGDGTACRWAGSSGDGGSSNGNRGFNSDMDANALAPQRNGVAPTTHLNNGGVSNGDYIVRILACDTSLIGSERCAQYPNGNFKPTGLLQDYATGQNKKIKFGLFTGSYAKNKSGGVLRKNPAFLDSATSANPSLFDAALDEINADTGVFNNAVSGIIKTFNTLKLYGYTYAAGTGSYTAADGCGLLNPDPTEGNCTSWGNPLSEMFVETLRYLAGKSPTAAFTYNEAAGQKDFDIGLRQPGWVNQITATNYCTPLNVIVMNASVNSYDNDQVGSDLFPSGTTAITLSNAAGDFEGLTGNFLIGNNGSTNNGICSGKSVGGGGSQLGNLSGICPEAPALRGSYQMVGAAHWAKTTRIRSDIAGVPASDARALKVTSYGVALASAVPTIQIPVPGTTRFVTIQPTARTFNAGADRGHGSIVDFKVIRQDQAAGTGKFFVSWEDSVQGNDYDLDMWGFISYRFLTSNTQIELTTDVVYAAAGHSIAFGFVISGTASSDGAHFLSAHEGNTNIVYRFPNGFNAASGTLECNGCDQASAPASATFNLSASGGASILKEPLWYSAKYGGFVDQNANNRPDLATEWDSKNNITGADGTDGNPDTYFPVTNPGALEQALDRAFISVLQVSSASSVATNSTSLQSGSTVYQARFNANEWSGQLLAFSISTTGAIDPVPLWDAGQLLPAPDSRTILTFNRDTVDQSLGATTKGIPFRWGSLNSLQQADLNKNTAGTSDPAGTECTGVTTTGFTPAGCTQQGPLRLNWLRGDAANEGATATKYRVRPTTKLGDIVNSTPIYIGPPSTFQYGDFSPPAAAYANEATYGSFASNATVANRTPIIYAAGNDGMLHGFDASTGSGRGVERLAYVPSTSYRHFTKLTDKTYSHRYFVDGSPTVADVKFSDGSWHTILVGGLNAGGQAVYALDITDPTNFTEANANNVVLWEWNDFNDDWVGNTYSQPSIAKMKNGRYAVIFGNGYNNSIGEAGDTRVSPSGCGTLYILFVDGGIDGRWDYNTDFVFVDVTASCSPANPNGVATPRVLTDADGVAEFVYAGDLRGNMWKFDVRSVNPDDWRTTGATLLFSAQDDLGTAQPITAAPTTVANLAGGTMVLFGTGKYLEQVDDTPPFTTQSFYGIWDKHDGAAPATRSQLLRQKVLGASASNPLGVTSDNPATSGVDESGFRVTTPYKPNYNPTPRTNSQFGESNPNAEDEFALSPPHRGWFLDFPFSGDSASFNPGTGERVVFRPIISTGKLVFTTLVPSTVPCQFGGTSFLMDMDPVSGSRLATSPFDVNNDSNFTTGDYVLDPAGNAVAVSGKASSIGIVPTPTVIQMSPSTGPGTPGKEVKVLSGSSGQLISVLELGGAPTLPGATGRRIQWRQLFTD